MFRTIFSSEPFQVDMSGFLKTVQFDFGLTLESIVNNFL